MAEAGSGVRLGCGVQAGAGQPCYGGVSLRQRRHAVPGQEAVPASTGEHGTDTRLHALLRDAQVLVGVAHPGVDVAHQRCAARDGAASRRQAWQQAAGGPWQHGASKPAKKCCPALAPTSTHQRHRRPHPTPNPTSTPRSHGRRPTAPGWQGRACSFPWPQPRRWAPASTAGAPGGGCTGSGPCATPGACGGGSGRDRRRETGAVASAAGAGAVVQRAPSPAAAGAKGSGWPAACRAAAGTRKAGAAAEASRGQTSAASLICAPHLLQAQHGRQQHRAPAAPAGAACAQGQTSARARHAIRWQPLQPAAHPRSHAPTRVRLPARPRAPGAAPEQLAAGRAVRQRGVQRDAAAQRDAAHEAGQGGVEARDARLARLHLPACGGGRWAGREAWSATRKRAPAVATHGLASCSAGCPSKPRRRRHAPRQLQNVFDIVLQASGRAGGRRQGRQHTASACRARQLRQAAAAHPCPALPDAAAASRARRA